MSKETYGIKAGQMYRTSENRVAEVLEVSEVDGWECEVKFKWQDSTGAFIVLPISKFMETFPPHEGDDSCYQPTLTSDEESDLDPAETLMELLKELPVFLEAAEAALQYVRNKGYDEGTDDSITARGIEDPALEKSLKDIYDRGVTVAAYIVVDRELEQLQFICYENGFVRQISRFHDGIEIYGSDVGESGHRSMGGLSAIKHKKQSETPKKVEKIEEKKEKTEEDSLKENHLL